MHLEELNDDCLDHLFEFLTLPDVVQLASVSHRFREKAKRWIAKHEIDFWRIVKCFRCMEPRIFFSTYGNLIERIRILAQHDQIVHLNLLPDYCTSIKYMRIAVNLNEIGRELSFIGRMQLVRSLHIEGDCVDMSVIEEIIKLVDLKSLQIYDTPISGYRLNELRKLTELVLCRCVNVTTERFCKAFLTNASLARINIHGCRNIGRHAYQCMAERPRLLESLEFDADTLLDAEFTSIPMPGFKYLKHLIIHNVEDTNFGEAILRHYSNALGETLTSLGCIHWCEFSFPESLLFPKLLELNVQCTSDKGGDNVLRRLGDSCPHLEKVTIRCDRDGGVTQDAVRDFFRQSKSVVLADLPIWDCLSVSLYKEIVGIRKAFGSVRRLKLLVGAKPLNAKFQEIQSFVKGNDHAALAKCVKLELYV